MTWQGVLLLFLGLLLGSNHAIADDSWHFRLSPYIWFAGLKGDVGTIPTLPTAPIDISASDALRDTETSFMIALDASKQRHGVFADLLYTDVQSDEELVPQPIGLKMQSTSKTTIFSLHYQYELYRQDQTVVSLLAGVRYWDLDSELRFKGGLGILAGRRISNRESWFDPALGMKGRAPLGSSKFYVQGGAGWGGFDVGSNHFYEISANVGYRWNKDLGTALGYRVFDVDYKDGGYVYDVKQQGWQVGLTWAF
jgi:hypothetical protein